jgi:ferredoxin
MKELVVISGKGGTGKTSVVASFAALARDKVLADCDVDAADLHLVLAPVVQKREDFSAGVRADVDAAACMGCGQCAEVCRFEAVSMDGPANDLIGKTYGIDPVACEGCGVCAWFCPVEAIALTAPVNGEWYVSSTRHGPMVHARLGIAEENSGKLVTLIRKEAKRLAQDKGLELIICDGSRHRLSGYRLHHRRKPGADCHGAHHVRPARPGAGCRAGPRVWPESGNLHKQERYQSGYDPGDCQPRRKSGPGGYGRGPVRPRSDKGAG